MTTTTTLCADVPYLFFFSSFQETSDALWGYSNECMQNVILFGGREEG